MPCILQLANHTKYGVFLINPFDFIVTTNSVIDQNKRWFFREWDSLKKKEKHVYRCYVSRLICCREILLNVKES